MRKRMTGAFLIILGVIAVWYSLILLAPIVWAQTVLIATAISNSVMANVNAFVEFQKLNPAVVGAICLVSGAVFAGIGYLLIKEKSYQVGRDSAGGASEFEKTAQSTVL